MVITKTLIKNCSFCKTPKNVLESVNNKLCENNEADMFVTVFMGFYNIPSGKFVYVNAGHNPPLIKKHGSGYDFLETEPGYVLAWMKDAQYKEKEIFIEPDDVLYLYTDGVTEAMNRKKELFGEGRLLAALNANRDSRPDELLSAVKREVDQFADGAEQADDITMLAIKINGALYSSVQKLKIEAKTENLNDVMRFISAELEKLEYPPDLKNEICIAVEEIFVNIVDYAYNPDSGNVDISISTKEKTVVKFEDTGRPYNPLEQASPDLEKPLLEREIGGLGVFMVKKIMDTTEYSRIGNKNVLVITKSHPE
jgi:sigma-B regulation protein RsbU (phosphoserine phosphatase)